MKCLLLRSSSFVFAGLAALPALANDTMADIKAGGLVFVNADNVEMAKEDLFISPDAVKVDYVFHNTGDKDQTAVVAFPMPDITGDVDFVLSIPDETSDNYMDFSVSVEGKPVTPEIDRHAFATEVDVTRLLGERGIPLLPYGKGTIEALGKLPQDVLDDFVRRGMIYRDEFDAGKGLQVEWVPLWRLKTTYYWDMTFPAGKDLRVSHRYKPSVGSTAGLNFINFEDDAHPFTGPAFEAEKAKYCFDAGFLKAIEKAQAANAKVEDHYLTESWLSYVLTTGANWGGTIGDFHLTIDKGDTDTLVSFCGEGVKKTGPTTFEIRARDFSPERDIDIALIRNSQM